MSTLACLKCSALPFFDLLIHPRGSVHIACECKYNEVIDIEDYLTKLSDKLLLIQQGCGKHNNQRKIYFCSSCREFLCEICKSQHIHEKNGIRSYKEPMIRTIEKRLVLIEKQFKEFSNTININDNKELISAYNKCMRENFCIINLIRTMIEYYYDYPKYELMQNLILIYVNDFNYLDRLPKNEEKLLCFINNFNIIHREYSTSKQYKIFYHYRIRSVVSLKNGKIAYSDDNNSIFIQKSPSDSIIKTEFPVDKLNLLDNNNIIGCSYKFQFMVINYQKGTYWKDKKENSLNAKEIFFLYHNKIAFYCPNGDIYIYSFLSDSIEAICVLNTKNEDMQCLIEIEQKDILLCDRDNTVEIYRINSKENEVIFSFAQEEEIQSIIQIDSNKILIGTISEIVTMNANTWEIQRRCKAGYSFMNLTLLRDNTIIFGDEKSLYQYNMNENLITCIKINKDRVQYIKVNNYIIAAYNEDYIELLLL